MKKRVPGVEPIPVFIREIHVIRGDYRFTNGFVTTPLSVVTRTKYMPAARPETLMQVGRDVARNVSTSVRTTLP